MEELAPGLWRWTRRHPEWHPARLRRRGRVVRPPRRRRARARSTRCSTARTTPCWRARGDGRGQRPHPDHDPLPRPQRRADLAAVCAGGTTSRSTGTPAARAASTTRRASARCSGGETLAGGIRAHSIGKPRRMEVPFELPSHRALAFGDAIVETGGGALRVWKQWEHVADRLVRGALPADAAPARRARRRSRARHARGARARRAGRGAREGARRAALVGAVTAPPVELRYRALTHHNPGRCAVTVYRMQAGPWVCVAENLDGHLGPPVRTAVRAVAAVIHRELIPAGVDWQLVLVGAGRPARARGVGRGVRRLVRAAAFRPTRVARLGGAASRPLDSALTLPHRL